MCTNRLNINTKILIHMNKQNKLKKNNNFETCEHMHCRVLKPSKSINKATFKIAYVQ